LRRRSRVWLAPSCVLFKIDNAECFEILAAESSKLIGFELLLCFNNNLVSRAKSAVFMNPVAYLSAFWSTVSGEYCLLPQKIAGLPWWSSDDPAQKVRV
jgi:hypothetical protein